MQPTAHDPLATPFERGNSNQTTDWAACIAFYERLAQQFPQVLRLFQIGMSDNGIPIHAGVVSADGVLDLESIRASGRPVFLTTTASTPASPKA